MKPRRPTSQVHENPSRFLTVKTWRNDLKNQPKPRQTPHRGNSYHHLKVAISSQAKPFHIRSIHGNSHEYKGQQQLNRASVEKIQTDVCW